MTKEEYLLKRRQLDRQYCNESGLIGKKLLSWVEQEKDLWVHIFEVETISIGRENDLWIKSTKENYEVYWEGNNNTGLTLGEKDNLVSDEVDYFEEIDDVDFNNIKEILINGKNSADRLELYRKASDYLRSRGYTARQVKQKEEV